MKPNPNEIMLQLADSMTTVVASVVGYRTQLEEAGFSPTAAETMATHFHQVLITAIFAKKS